MKRLILLLVVILHSIRFYNDYRSSFALTDASATENTYFFSNRYFQFEKGKYSIQMLIFFTLSILFVNLFEI